ncbi:MAG: glycosyltransferase family 1 protein [bacterium]|nr:glycosyltransferase family 1 protein [bacterium]
MKIVVNTRSLISNKLDGIGWFTYQTLKRITQSHPEHEFIFLFDRPYSKEFIFANNIKPIVLFPPARHPFLYLIYYQWSVRNLLNKLKPDIFLSTDGLLVLGCKTKQLAVVHDINFHHYPNDLKYFYRKYYNFFMPKFVAAADCIATVSEFSKRDLVETYGTEPTKISVVYNGINEGYKKLGTERQLETQNKFSQGKPYFLFVGSQSPRKNLVRLIEAFNLFKIKSGSPYKLLIVGASFWGDEAIEDVLKKCEHIDDIIFTGRVIQSDLEDIMGSAFALSFLSYFEGFGIPLVEAMECEVPIICSNASCMPEIAGDAAVYVNPFNVNEISEGMLKLYQNPALVQTVIEKGKEQKLKFSWDKTAEKLWHLIENETKKNH